MVRLTPNEIEPYLSPYLMGGWRQDTLVLETVDVDDGYVRGTVCAVEFFLPGDGRFHLTIPSVFIWVSQLAIIYGCWEQKLPRKPGEIYVRDIQLKCKRPVNDPRQIDFELTLASKRAMPEGIFSSGNISVDRGAFVGKGRFVLPVPGAVSVARRLAAPLGVTSDV